MISNIADKSKRAMNTKNYKFQNEQYYSIDRGRKRASEIVIHDIR